MSSALHAGEIQCLGNDLGLAFDAGREIAHLARAIIVDRRSENDGANMVAIFERIFKTPQHDDAEAASKDRAAGGCVEGPAMAVARKNLAFAIDIAVAMRDFDGDSAGQSHVALEVEQALAGQMNRDQRSGARGLHVDAGAAQVKLIGNTRGQHVLVVAGLLELEQARGFKQAAVGEQVMDQVGVHARSGKDADRAVESLRRMAGVFESLPCALEKMPMLRIHDGCISRAEAEEGCIEHGDVVEQRGSLDVVRVGQLLWRRAGGEQFRIGAVADGLDAIAQVLPELGDVAGAGKTACHADDRNGERASLHSFSALPASLRRCARSEAEPLRDCEFRQDGGERAHRGELKQIDESNLAAQASCSLACTSATVSE